MLCECVAVGRDKTPAHSPARLGGGLFQQLSASRWYPAYACMNHSIIYERAMVVLDYWKFDCWIVPVYEKKSWKGKYMGAKSNSWVAGWDVTGSQGDCYRVSQKADGSFGCSCPAWKFKKAPKPDCKHIRAMKAAQSTSNSGWPKEFAGVGIAKAPKAIVTAKCKFCDAEFSNMNLLSRHIRSLHPLDSRDSAYVSPFRPLPAWYKEAIAAEQAEEKELQEQPQDVQVNGDRFTITRKFKFAQE